MSDTIDLLEAIGKNATLRHASNEDLAQALNDADASDALKAAAGSGDSAHLAAEFGHHPMRVNHNVHAPGHEEDPGHDHHHGDGHPHPPAKPDHAEPTHD